MYNRSIQKTVTDVTHLKNRYRKTEQKMTSKRKIRDETICKND